MTKRKAIEAAMERWVEARRHLVAVDIEDVIAGSCVEKAYELGRIAGRIEGRIAGIREAIAQLPSEGLIRAWDTKRKLRQWANALAKKVRAK